MEQDWTERSEGQWISQATAAFYLAIDISCFRLGAAKDNHVTLLWSTRRVVVAEAAFRATTAATAIAAAAAAVAACGSCWTAAAAAASLKKKTA